MPVAANRARFGFSITGVSAELRLLAFQGREALSEPFDFHVDLVSPDPELDPSAWLGLAACITLEGPEPCCRHGIVRSAQWLGFEGRFTRYRLHLVPLLHRLALRGGLRIFQQLSVPDIVCQLLREAGLTASDFRIELGRAYSPKEYCVQYNETDLQFLRRLLAEEGIHFHFEHFQNRHVLVLGDQARSFQYLPGRRLSYGSEGGMAGDSVIHEFRDRRAKVIEFFEHGDYNPMKPSHGLWSQAESGAGSPLRARDWPGGFEDVEQGAAKARDRLAALRLGRHFVQGASDVVQLLPAVCFELRHHPRTDFNRDYLVLSVEHQGEQPQVLEEYQGTGACQYSNRFTAIPASCEFRPQPMPKPYARTQTAEVVGPQGAAVHTDAMGRIQVRFHWDREDKHSCWLRVVQDWAGAFWGTQVLPRVGQEVLVEFIDGDPDRPIVTGCLYNGVNLPPCVLPEHQSRTMLRTQGLNGGEGHEILIEDQPGEDRIGVRSAGDLELLARRDHQATLGGQDHCHIQGESRITVGGSHHLWVGGDRREQVAGQESLQVEQNLHLNAGQSIHYQSGQELHLKAGLRLMIEASEGIHLKAGVGSLLIDPAGIWIDGPLIGLNLGQPGASASPAHTTCPAVADQLIQVSAGQSLQPIPGTETLPSKPLTSIYLDKTLEPLMREQILALAEAGQALGELCQRQPDGSCPKPGCRCGRGSGYG